MPNWMLLAFKNHCSFRITLIAVSYVLGKGPRPQCPFFWLDNIPYLQIILEVWSWWVADVKTAWKNIRLITIEVFWFKWIAFKVCNFQYLDLFKILVPSLEEILPAVHSSRFSSGTTKTPRYLIFPSFNTPKASTIPSRSITNLCTFGFTPLAAAKSSMRLCTFVGANTLPWIVIPFNNMAY